MKMVKQFVINCTLSFLVYYLFLTSSVKIFKFPHFYMFLCIQQITIKNKTMQIQNSVLCRERVHIKLIVSQVLKYIVYDIVNSYKFGLYEI